jgi:ABC-type dipeptide/oligopeptide/nickel transport system permease subunit
MNLFFPWEKALRRKTVWFSLVVMLFFGGVAVLAPWLAPYDPYRGSFSQSSLPPMWVQTGSNPGRPEYPLGSDRYGRDILSRQIYGTRTAVFLALTAVPLAALLGTLLGLTAGYMGGRWDAMILLLTDIIQALPGILFLVIIVLLFRSLFTPTWLSGWFTLVVGFAAVSWAGLARLIRVNVLLLKSQPFVEAAIGLGASPRQIIFHHLLPNVLHVIVVWVINNIPAVILLEALLGYVGVGVTRAVDGGEFTVVSWGGLFFAGRSALSYNLPMLLVPSLSILLISMSFILLGDFLNETTRHHPA